MQTVAEAIAQGWEMVLPAQHMGGDELLILMRHRRPDGMYELGFALTRPLASMRRD